MAASETALVYREDADAFKKSLNRTDMRMIGAQHEADYVDLNKLLDLKLEDQPETLASKGKRNEFKGSPEGSLERSSSFETAPSEFPNKDTEGRQTSEKRAASPNLINESNEVYMSSKSESDDDVTVVLSDDAAEAREDESHFITTHEIQLLELDHDVDYDIETGSSWELEDDLRVYTFVDYASFDSDETVERKEANASAALPESNTCDADKSASSDESLSKKPATAGQIHLSIKATSRAVSEPKQNCTKDKSRKASDSTKCFIALPGRLHFGKRKNKDVNEHSSGASSAVSELDDADKEVRNLTARAFKSLAYPYFDAINFSTSSESSVSVSEYGPWSTFVDFKYAKGRDQNIIAHKGSSSNFHFAQKRDGKGITGLTLTSMRAPPVEIFALNGNLVAHKNASSTTKKFELMGKFSQGQSGLIRLTETLNFRSNVKSLHSVNESGTGSRSTDEVTNTLPSAQESKRACNAEETMEDTHKKAIFASSLLKNVISKKMQFEQERKMERGEICEAHHAPSPCFGTLEAQRSARKNSIGLQRQGSKYSDSDYTIVSVDDLGDIVDGDSQEDARNDESAADTRLESEKDTKKEAFEASKRTLLRSQNSAFRSWRDGELEFQKEHKNDKTPEDASACDRRTKMSHLFVPSIQLPVAERDPRKADLNASYYTEKCDSNTFFAPEETRGSLPAKSPEIKISLRSVRDNKSHPFNLAKLLTPSKTAEEARCQALAAAFKGESDKVPHFIVRDIRENKGKLQTPIHQVRDVRKLVKSSYHFVSLDNDAKSSHSPSDVEQKPLKQSPYLNSASLTPIVIKCQSVNTNSNVKQSGNLIDPPKRRIGEDVSEADRSSPHVAMANRLPKQEHPAGVRIESSAKKQEKASDAKAEPKKANQAAYEKLQAAVKTMEQLYIFDRNEWKRKTKPHPITDSHVLSLLSSEDNAVEDQDGGVSTDSNPTFSESLPKTDKIPIPREERNNRKTLVHLTGMLRKKTSVASKATHTASLNSKATAPKLPTSLKMPQAQRVSASTETDFFPLRFTSTADSENYITIPIKPHAKPAVKPTTPASAKSTMYTIPSGATKPQTGNPSSPLVQNASIGHPKHSVFLMETRSPDTPTATIYHSPLPIPIQAAHPQVFCFSPTVQPSPIPTEPFQATQRKMLLDPTTGSYYLVDTPVQPATRRLFDPETGQYVDVPMPPQPPMTPVPALPISPLALSPGGYSHSFMFYPGYMPTMIPARSIQSQLSMQSDADDGEKCHPHTGQQEDGAYLEKPYYMPSGQSSQSSSMTQHISSSKQPVISITSQQGPRIIAPPSFDGTTMSFVVEHR